MPQVVLPSELMGARAQELYDDHYRAICVRTDRLFLWLMPLEWLASIGVAMWISPEAWAGRTSAAHPHIWAALILGGIITLWPVVCAIKWPGAAVTRHVIGIGQMLMSALLIHLTGGRIETHFSIFGSLAFLAFYRDWRVLLSASAVVAADHFLRGVYFPLSIFGTLTASPYRWLEHVWWVLFEDMFLVISIQQSIEWVRGIARQQASLEGINKNIARTVEERTAELRQENAERKQLGEELVRERRQFEEILNNIPLVVFENFTGSGKGRYFVNNYIEKMCGYTPAEWTSTPDFWLTTVHPEDRERVAAESQGVLDPSGEWRWIAKDGHVVWGQTIMTGVRDEAGQLMGARGITIDITARKDAEAEMDRMQRQLLDASRHAGMAEVAANVLHNVGNVLNSVNISCSVICDQVKNSGISSVTRAAELMEKHGDGLAAFLTTHPSGKKLPEFLGKLAKWLTEEQASVLAELEVLTRNVDHIKEIIKVEQSYAEAGGLHETLRMTGLVENAIQINAGSLDRHGIKIVREYSEIPPASVQKHKVMQILINLIKNAKDAMAESQCEEKRLVVRAGCEDGRIRVSVSDNGMGILKENLTRIFAHGFTTKKQGNGFGLHSSALAAHEMGGSLAAQSDGQGRGATFILELPLKEEAAAVRKPVLVTAGGL